MLRSIFLSFLICILMNTNTANFDEIYHVGFNQDSTSLAIGYKKGFTVFKLNSVDSLSPIFNSYEFDKVHIVERFFDKPFLAIVERTSPRKLRIFNAERGIEKCIHNYSNDILSVKVGWKRFVVCLKDAIHIHNSRNMKVMHSIKYMPPNSAGLCSLSMSSSNCYLAYPGSTMVGEVQIFDALNLISKKIIMAHNSSLAALAFSHQGYRIATASAKGTVIRVFSVCDGSKLFEFRRGMRRCVTICSMTFSMDGSYLCCSSNTETVHVFKLDEPEYSKQKLPLEYSSSVMESIFKAFSLSAANFLPAQVTEVFTQERPILSVHLGNAGIKTICALVIMQGVLRLLVASQDKYLHAYDLSTDENGQCTILGQHLIQLDDLREDLLGNETTSKSSICNGESEKPSCPTKQS